MGVNEWSSRDCLEPQFGIDGLLAQADFHHVVSLGATEDAEEPGLYCFLLYGCMIQQLDHGKLEMDAHPQRS